MTEQAPLAQQAARGGFLTRWRGTAVRVLVAAALVVFVATQVDVRAVLGHLGGAPLLSVLLVQPIMVVAFAMIAWRHAVLVRQPRTPFPVAFRAVMLSIGLNAVLPGRLAELLKATYLRDHAQTGFSAGIAAVLTERLVDLVIVGLLALVAAALLVVEMNVVLILVLIGVAILMLFALARAEGIVRIVAPRLPSRAIALFLERTLAETARHARQGRLPGAFGLGIVIWSLSFSAVAVVVLFAGSIPVPVGGLLAVFVATSLGGAIPALPGGLGTYEAAAVLVLRRFGYGDAEALALGLAMHLAQFAVPVPASIVILASERVGVAALVRDLRRGPAPSAD